MSDTSAQIQEKLERLQRMAAAAHDQGRSPKDVPLTLQDALDVTGLLFVLSTRYDHHHHDVTVNKTERETSAPK